MKLFTVKCPKHGEFEVGALPNGKCPTVCPIISQGKVCALNLIRKFSVPTVIYNAAGFTKRVEK